MDFKSAFKNAVNKVTNSLASASTFSGGNDFLRYGNRDSMIPDWSNVEMAREDFYRGYSFAVIQKRGNKVASLAQTNLKTFASPETIDELQKQKKTPYHPYLTVIEDSTKFTEKQFWKNISIYLDLAGRYYLGVIRTKIGTSGLVSDVKEFIMLNPYEVRRVVNSKGELAGYIEHKKDGRYREWPIYQIIEMRELNPFNPDESQWAMVDAAKNAVFTLQEGGNYTRQSLHGNIDAPGIITTDVILDDESFANFRARVTQHTKGEPLFGNGAGAIKWESMQVDLDKAALLDINNMNREELFAVSGTSKTTLGIEQSGTTRETARVQNENFASDTAQPRLEDIIGFLNLDFKQHYENLYKQTQFSIIVESAVGTDYAIELDATETRQAQLDLALNLIKAKYTPESAYQYAVGEIGLSNLELQEGYDLPELNSGLSSSNQKDDGEDDEDNEGDSSSGEDNPKTPNTPQVETNSVGTAPEDQGWIGARVQPIEVSKKLTSGLKAQLYTGDLGAEITNIPAEKNPHYTVVYGLKSEAFETPDIDINELVQENLPKEVIVNDIISFNGDDCNIIVAELVKTVPMERLNINLLNLGHWPLEHEEYRPHITLCYINKTADPADFINVFRDLIGKSIPVVGYDIDNPYRQENSFNESDANQAIEAEDNEVKCSCEQKTIADFVNELGELEGQSLRDAYDALLGEIRDVQKDAIQLSSKNVTVNNFSQEDLADEEQRIGLLKRLESAFKKYWWFIIPMLGKRAMANRNKEFDKKITFVFNEDLQKKILDEVKEVSEGHLNTIFKDILDTANRAFTNVVEETAVDLVITAYRNDPSRFSEYFMVEPSKFEVISAINNTDILEKNRKIYDKAYTLATEGYNRQEIIEKIQGEYEYLSDVRANTIAGNETARAFTQSQYEADYQFLKNTGNLTTAYKQLFSRTGDPCPYCQAIIDKGPIPFMENFLDKGESITIEQNGKTHTFTADYEAITAGVVHVNCHCGYRLLLNYKSENSFEGHLGRKGYKGGSMPRNQISCPKSASEEFISSLNDVASEFANQYGFSPSSITVKSQNQPLTGEVEFGRAEINPKTGNPVIYIDRRVLTGNLERKQQMQKAFLDGESSSATIKGLLTHEMTHALVNHYLLEAGFSKEKLKAYSETGASTILSKGLKIPRYKVNEKNFNEVSKYATKNKQELLCEIISAERPLSYQKNVQEALAHGFTREEYEGKRKIKPEKVQ